jgi:hypothetical protein
MEPETLVEQYKVQDYSERVFKEVGVISRTRYLPILIGNFSNVFLLVHIYLYSPSTM